MREITYEVSSNLLSTGTTTIYVATLPTDQFEASFEEIELVVGDGYDYATEIDIDKIIDETSPDTAPSSDTEIDDIIDSTYADGSEDVTNEGSESDIDAFL